MLTGLTARTRPPLPAVAVVPNVLVAVEDGARRRVRSVLAASRLTFVATPARLAECLARERFGLVLIGAGFDAGRAALALETVLRSAPGTAVLTFDFARWHDDREGKARLRALIASLALLGAGACALPPAVAPGVEVEHLSEAKTAAQTARLEVLYARPRSAHLALARLHASGAPVPKLQEMLRARATALGADALVLDEVRGDGIEAVAIEYLETGR
jgi:hypothetical protein